MYNASNDFKTKIKESERLFIYSGSIVTKGGTTYSFTGENIRSGRIRRAISGDKLEIGTVYASELRIELSSTLKVGNQEVSVSRYELYDGVITLNVQLDGAADVIPMGYYTISEINQTTDRLNIKAMDDMIKFSETYNPDDSTNTMLPYMWLAKICSKCGVTLGHTSAQIYSLPNGNRTTGFANVATDVKTYRDVLGYLAAYLCSYAYIGRDGKLYLGQYGSVSADTVLSSFRYTSGLSDYRTTYDGLYATYKNGAIQEYVSNSNTGGLVLDMGANPFLQIDNDTNRRAALQSIIDAWNGIYYVPYKSEIPAIPIYDPGDILTFTGNQADQYDYGTITELTYNIGGKMNVTCSGDNPRLAAAQDRFSKSIEGLSSEYGLTSGDKDFWLIFTVNDVPLLVEDTEIEIAELEYEQKTYTQNVEMVLSLTAELSDTADVSIRIIVDDDEDMEINLVESHSMKGTRMFHGSNPNKITGQGLHTAKVYMTVTDSPTLWSDLV